MNQEASLTGSVTWVRDPLPAEDWQLPRFEPYPRWVGGLAVVDPTLVNLDPHLMQVFPATLLAQHRVLPLCQEAQTLVVGMHDPLDHQAHRAIARSTNLEVLIVQLAEGGGPLPATSTLRYSLGPERIENFRLQSTKVQARIVGPMAEVEIRQVFYNPAKSPGIGHYTFPLSSRAVVKNLDFWAGDSPLRPRASAAKAQPGISAILGPVAAQQSVEVCLTYVQEIQEDEILGAFCFRQVCPEPEDGSQLEVLIDLEMPDLCIESLASTQHAVWRKISENHLRIRLNSSRPRLQRDFLLCYQSRSRPRGQLYSDGKHFLIHLQPSNSALSTPKDLHILIDQSASLTPQDRQKLWKAALEVVRHLRAEDRFSLGLFDEDLLLWREGKLAYRNQIESARDWLHSNCQSGLNSDFRPSLHWLARQVREPDRDSYALLLSDGIVGQQNATLQLAKKLPPTRPIFCVSLRYDEGHRFLKQIAAIGRGTCESLDQHESLQGVAARLVRSMAPPVLSQLHMVGQGFHSDPASLEPASLPDIFPSQQLNILGKHDGYGPVLMLGKERNEACSFALPLQKTNHPALPLLWAKAHLGSLQARYLSAPVEARESILVAIEKLRHRYLHAELRATELYPNRLLEILPSIADNADEDRSEHPKPLMNAARLADWIFHRAAEATASHVHIEGHQDVVRVRFRVAGQLLLAATPAADIHGPLIEHLRGWAQMPEFKGQIQYGQLLRSYGGQRFSLHITICPTVQGERAVIELRPCQPRFPDSIGLADAGQPQ